MDAGLVLIGGKQLQNCSATREASPVPSWSSWISAGCFWLAEIMLEWGCTRPSWAGAISCKWECAKHSSYWGCLGPFYKFCKTLGIFDLKSLLLQTLTLEHCWQVLLAFAAWMRLSYGYVLVIQEKHFCCLFACLCCTSTCIW
jgi:hypothetical protein